ncbi:3-hydroxyacyl-CoA dehydrogenase [Pseudodonghicola xiamenensis]|uniref:3-hydroxybutyryl-CoA dehydrogenase n=1 Tax=Pseudodonghicola xiamenensis TaxID=337702 RepID=A0A8J3MCL9_9RHOB|nr:3-hydroxyacyl-CoA dehydrogenase [Pseudodonghicola xiamenensis]GHG87081.1 3-hydroxybutyryl-CoA dehydrogenase [Pseudodonghicola xiamenensis]
MTIKTVTVLGTGVLGAQIAFQTAYHGFQVTAYDLGDEQIAKAKKTMDWLAARYLADLPGATQADIDTAFANLSYATDLTEAAKDADLVIEAVPEAIELKKKVYAALNEAAPAKTIFASNSSTLLPSAMAEATGRPAQFTSLHFANEIWTHNIAEIMDHPGTDPKVHAEVVAFARAIGMEPIEVLKEQPGYVLNSLLVPFLRAAAGLFTNGIASPADIDKTWRIATGAPKGPFEIYDIVGLTTAYNISLMSQDDTQLKFAARLKEDYIDKGKLGVATGEGFYKYPRD